eukprot:gene4369-5108_t
MLPETEDYLSLIVRNIKIQEGDALWDERTINGVEQIIEPTTILATISLRRLLSVEDSPPIQQVIDSGAVVPRIISLLQIYDHPQLQYEAAWILAIIANGTTQQTKAIIDSGAISILVENHLNSVNNNVREQAVWALGSIAKVSMDCRDLILSRGALPLILGLLDGEPKIRMTRNSTWTIANLCRGDRSPPIQIVRIVLPMLSQLINHQDQEVLVDACLAISFLAEGHDNIKAIIQSGACRRILELFDHPSIDVQVPALRIIGNIVTYGDENQTQFIINQGAIPSLNRLLVSTDKPKVKKETCWIISNINAGTTEHIQLVIKAKMIPILIGLMTQGECIKEATWAVCNAITGATPKQIEYMAQQGSIPALCSLLNHPDHSIIHLALDGINNILGQNPDTESPYAPMVQECGCVEKIIALKDHTDNKVSEIAIMICSHYLGLEDNQQQSSNEY